MRKCPRTLDKPILFFGLEMEDVALLFLGVGIGGLIVGPLVPGIAGAAGWIILLKFKKDKPDGYLLHWLYGQGVGLKGLIPPPTKIKFYGAYGTGQIQKF
jgi:hypothetical protein